MACKEEKGFWDKNLKEFHTADEVESIEDDAGQSGAFIPCVKLSCDGIKNVYAYKNSLDAKYSYRVLSMDLNEDDGTVECIIKESKEKVMEGNLFKKGDVVIAKDEFLASHEKPEDTVGIVVSYNPENDYLVIGDAIKGNHALPHTFSTRGEFYRIATDKELKDFGLLEPVSENSIASVVDDILNGGDVRKLLLKEDGNRPEDLNRMLYSRLNTVLNNWGSYIWDEEQWLSLVTDVAKDVWKDLGK